MTRNQIEKFALGYPYPTDYVEIILRKCGFDKEKVHQILCGSFNDVVKMVQS